MSLTGECKASSSITHVCETRILTTRVQVVIQQPVALGDAQPRLEFDGFWSVQSAKVLP
jgi:hypothetical protein